MHTVVVFNQKIRNRFCITFFLCEFWHASVAVWYYCSFLVHVSWKLLAFYRCLFIYDLCKHRCHGHMGIQLDVGLNGYWQTWRVFPPCTSSSGRHSNCMYVQPPKSLTSVRSGDFIRASVPHDGAYWHEMVFWACALLMYFYRHPLFNLALSYGADAQEMSEHGHAI